MQQNRTLSFEKNVYALIDDLKQFEYKLDYRDRIWEFIFPDAKRQFHRIRVTKCDEMFFISLFDGEICTLEVKPKKSVGVADTFGLRSYDESRHNPAKTWDPLILSSRKWLSYVLKDWIKANKIAHESYPLNKCYGLVPNSLIRASLPDIYRIDKELGRAKSKQFIELVEEGYFRDSAKTTRESMTANDYFNYCKIAYLAAQRKEECIDKSLSGCAMYKLYADGRDDGLLEIDPDSTSEFETWIDYKHPKRSQGGHPWEIKRGGNTTHIDLSVSRPDHYTQKGFKVGLRGASIGRLKETICMFLAIHKAGLPITISDPEGIHKRLLAQDNIGIIPCFHSLHRANQRFREHENVFDVLHFDELGRFKTRIKPFISWEPLPIIKPVAN
jgi:hypothetical protein